MRVNINQVSSNQIELEKTSAEKTSQAAASNAKVEDSTSLSSDSAAISALQQQALAAPDVRQDKVNFLKQQIQSGQYKLDPDEIAKAMREEDV